MKYPKAFLNENNLIFINKFADDKDEVFNIYDLRTYANCDFLYPTMGWVDIGQLQYDHLKPLSNTDLKRIKIKGKLLL